MPMDPSSANREDAISKVLLIIGLALVVGAVLVYHYSPQFQPQTPRPQQASADTAVEPPPAYLPAIRGKPVAAFDLKDLSGKQVRPADFKGKVVLVNFWATWCGPCLIEIPWFLEFKERYGSQGLEVLAISMDEEGPKVVKPFVERHKMEPLRVAMGEESTGTLFGGLRGLPTTFLVDRDGNYYSKHEGLLTKEEVEGEIQALLQKQDAAEPVKSSSANPSPSGAQSSSVTPGS
jgi:thiol-disulfide isomerase/thioredoxin